MTVTLSMRLGRRLLVAFAAAVLVAPAAPVLATGPAFTLSGTVTASGSPLSGANVHAFDSYTGAWVSYTTSGAGGSYGLTLSAGEYRLYLQPDEPGYADGWHGGSSFDTASVVAVEADTVLDIPRLPSHTLSGAVTVGGAGLSGAYVHAFDAATGAWAAWTTSTSGGAYSLLLTAGSYKLYVQPNQPGHADGWHGGTSFAAATTVVLDANKVIEIARLAVHTLSGTVRVGSVGLPGANVHAFAATTGAWRGWAASSTGGAYSLALPAGSYKLYLQPNEAGAADGWHGGTTFAAATTIVLGADKVVDIDRPAIHVLSGSLTAGGTPVAGATITIWDATTVQPVASAASNAGGAYSVPLGEGSYKLFVEPGIEGYGDGWHGGLLFETATTLVLDQDRTVDIARPRTHTVSGTVTASGAPLAGATIHVFSASTGRWEWWLTSPADGSFGIMLPAGDYKLYVQPNEPGYADGWHGGSTWDSATTVVVDQDKVLNVPRVPSHALSGTVFAGPTGLAGVEVHAFDATTGSWWLAATSGAGGGYSLVLPQGSYKLYMVSNEPGWWNSWHGGWTFAEAALVTLAADRTEILHLEPEVTTNAVPAQPAVPAGG